jgi:hypothetical protein
VCLVPEQYSNKTITAIDPRQHRAASTIKRYLVNKASELWPAQTLYAHRTFQSRSRSVDSHTAELRENGYTQSSVLVTNRKEPDIHSNQNDP